MTRNRLYSILFIACFFGFIYLFYHLNHSDSYIPSVCLIKNVTGYACPSCGTTEAVQLLTEGKFTASILHNPFGIPVALIMTIVPLWVTIDVVSGRDTFYQFYKKAESIIRKPKVALVLLLLVLMNWIWNLYKHL